MKREEVKEQVMKNISEIADISMEEITEDSTLMNDLVLSSMEVFGVVAKLEDIFNIVIREKEIRTYITVENMIDALTEKLNKK